MRKLLLLLFLFSLSSNALAKVEIWECDDNSIFKIDTSIPTVYYRFNSLWFNLSYAPDVTAMEDLGAVPQTHDYFMFEHVIEDDSIFIYAPNGEDFLGGLDLLSRKHFNYTDNKYEIIKTCKLYVQ
jgi:hypothetical protein